MPNLGSDIEARQKQLESKLTERLIHFDSRLADATKNTTDHSIDTLAKEFFEFKTFVVEILAMLRQQIAELQRSFDKIESRNRADCIILRGIPEDAGGDTPQHIVEILRNKLSLNSVNVESIRSWYRLGGAVEGAVRPVLIKFHDYRMRQAMWLNKSRFKGSPYSCAEFLTKHRQNLYIEAKKLFGMRNCWTQDGNIVLKLPDGTFRRLFLQNELMELAIKFNKDKDGSSQAMSNDAYQIKSIQKETKERVKRVKK